ncbi:MAG: prepilin-type N-terminal cleavage/methylation domain-containing protein [Desulfobacterota bacterium]|nr:prepilin-type N-terminal cleavage/methylation domain-containing protein [Thermodesulfobacteriota bacterium]
MKSIRWSQGFRKQGQNTSPLFRISDFGFRIRNSAIRNLHSTFDKGFTLIEIIVVIVILSVVSAITIKFLIDSLKIYTMTVNQKMLYDEGKLALERMVRDIRDARSITSVTASSITFVRTNPTAQDSADETIIFRLDPMNNTILQKVKTSPATTATMANNVTEFAVTNTANEIQLRLKLQRTSGEEVILQTRVYPKNLPTSLTNKNFKQNWREVPSS